MATSNKLQHPKYKIHDCVYYLSSTTCKSIKCKVRDVDYQSISDGEFTYVLESCDSDECVIEANESKIRRKRISLKA